MGSKPRKTKSKRSGSRSAESRNAEILSSESQQSSSGSTQIEQVGAEATLSFDRHSKRFAPLLLVLYLLAWFYCFGDTLLGDTIFVFRDSGNWHMPVLNWTSQQWAAGQVPLWNDYQGLGLNWVGQGTTTVFYPPAWLLAVPIGSFHNKYALLLGGHIVLATINAYFGARQFNVSRWAALLIAIAYSWSSPVLIQHSNWPFLVSAAWLPLAFGCFWRWLSHPIPNRPALALAASAMAMMVLGGDPQGAYICCGLGLVAIGVLSWFATGHRVAVLFSTSIRWAILIVLTVGCSTVQLWSTAESAVDSTRTLQPLNENIYASMTSWLLQSPDEVATEEVRTSAKDPMSPERKALNFSQTPWSVFSLLSPNLFGTWRDYNRRWEQAIPATDRPWNPNLYVGLIPAILSAAAFIYWLPFAKQQRKPISDSSRHELPKVRWLQIIVIFCGLASLGWYGVGWAMNELGWIDLKTSTIRPETGGIHWLLSWLLPGYASFRFPAKVWQFAGFGICCLAGLFWDTWRSDFQRLANRIVLPITMLFLLMIALAFAVVLHPRGWAWVSHDVNNRIVDPWLGYMRVDLALADVQNSLFQSIVVALIFWVFVYVAKKLTTNSESTVDGDQVRGVASLFVVSVVLLDLTVANSWQFMKTDRTCLNPAASAKRFEQGWATEKDDLGKSRLFYATKATDNFRMSEMNRKWGPSWIERPVNKLAWQAMRSMRSTWMPQMHLAVPLSVVNADSTLRPGYHKYLLDAVSRKCRQLPEKDAVVVWHKFLRSQGVSRLQLSPVVGNGQAEPGVQVQPIQSLESSVWLASQIQVRPKPARLLSAVEADIEAVWLTPLQVLEQSWNQQPVTVGQEPPAYFSDQQEDAPKESQKPAGKVIEYQLTQRNKTAEIDLAQPALVCWNFGFDPGWQCTVSSISTEDSTEKQSIEPAVAVNRIHTGVWLPAGQHKLSWHYQPKWWTWGGPITLVSWLLLGILAFWKFRGSPQDIAPQDKESQGKETS